MSNQGQGGSTPRKQEGFARLFRQCLYLSRGALPFAYWHLHLNAGEGFNHVAGCEGSPITFIQEALKVGRRFHAFFCDNDPALTEKLRGAVLATTPWPDGSSATIRTSDNAQLFAAVADAIREEEPNPAHAVGSCLCRHGFPEKEMAAFAERFPKIDLIFHLNVSLFARVRGCKASPNPSRSKGFGEWELGELIGRFARPHWWLRNPPPHSWGGERFITFLGRTMRPDRRRFTDFYPLGSRIGREILRTFRHNPGGLLPFMWEDCP